MNTLKGWITTFCLVAMLLVTTSVARADGIIIGGRTVQEPCKDTVVKDEKTNWGIIIGGFGIIIGGFGIIIGGAVDQEPAENCGIIIGG